MNLPFAASEDQLRILFENYGLVECATTVPDKFTGHPRGFRFVKMPEREEELRARSELDSKDYIGFNRKINEARPSTDY